jgi:hypothetical protein
MRGSRAAGKHFLDSFSAFLLSRVNSASTSDLRLETLWLAQPRLQFFVF